MSFEHLRVERRDHVVRCELVNPPRNLMNARMVRELDALTREVEANRDDRVLLLTGGLEGVFILHYDVGELSGLAERMTGEGTRPRAERQPVADLHGVLSRLERIHAITIAALNGTAMGGGCELSLACDFRLIADGPFRYGLPETSVGIIPGAGGTQRMTRLIGVARALDLILHARVLEPREALELGLVHRLLPAEGFAEAAFAFAADLAKRAPIALAAAKEAIRRGAELGLDEGLAVERDAFARTMRSADARGAMRAYLKGEPFEFKGE